jgi:hypothetical protein
MNLFLINTNALKAAIAHCDKHCVKMILETTQLLYCAWHMNRPGTLALTEVVASDPCPHKAYKCTHKNHPSSRWVRAHAAHYKWALCLGFALCAEYTRRYGKIHKCQSHLDRLHLLGYPKPSKHAAETAKSHPPIAKRALVGIPRGCKYFDCAINDEVFDSCASYDEEGRLHGVNTYRNYYMTKGTDKWTLKWGRDADATPLWFQ